ncbi:unnamed protein product [Cylicocyclus nassatus]|uniref:Uncharacterized protein n=1 Tax=Cylicocyclus nassatus TaxID=53992 RepID=A0AA36GI87_CYLNA|nr:unnamed protein product [Cylicocyclus nassatus]
MPVRRSKNDDPAPASPPAWLKEILQRWDDYFTRITWVGIDEKESDHATQAFDCEAIKEVIEVSGNEELLREWNNKKIDV